jgi:hypothetical protein
MLAGWHFRTWTPFPPTLREPRGPNCKTRYRSRLNVAHLASKPRFPSAEYQAEHQAGRRPFVSAVTTST